MDYDAYEKLIISLCENQEFEKAEEKKKEAIPEIKILLKSNYDLDLKFLDLFSQLAGEAESFENFCNLLDELTAENLISKNCAEDFIRNSPANRWL